MNQIEFLEDLFGTSDVEVWLEYNPRYNQYTIDGVQYALDILERGSGVTARVSRTVGWFDQGILEGILHSPANAHYTMEVRLISMDTQNALEIHFDENPFQV